MKRPKKKIDPRIREVALLLCDLWGDDWGLGWRFHTANAKIIIDLLEKNK